MKTKLLLLSILCLLLPLINYAQESKDVSRIKDMLHRQSEKWNNFDIDGFMEDYWKSDQLLFLSSSGPIYGWKATLERYKRKYPDQAAMGKLKFDILNVILRSRKVATVVGKFHLTRPEVGDLSGYFLLVCKKIKGRWKIVADHTS